MSETLTFNALIKLLEEFKPPLRSVIIVAKWLPGPNGLRRIKDGCEEFRLPPKAFAALVRDATPIPSEPYASLTGVEVRYEDKPPDEFIKQFLGVPTPEQAPT